MSMTEGKVFRRGPSHQAKVENGRHKSASEVQERASAYSQVFDYLATDEMLRVEQCVWHANAVHNDGD